MTRRRDLKEVENIYGAKKKIGRDPKHTQKNKALSTLPTKPEITPEVIDCVKNMILVGYSDEEIERILQYKVDNLKKDYPHIFALRLRVLDMLAYNSLRRNLEECNPAITMFYLRSKCGFSEDAVKAQIDEKLKEKKITIEFVDGMLELDSNN